MDPFQQELSDLLKLIHSVYGYDFTQYAQSSVRRRVESFLANHKIPGLQDLEFMLLKDEHFFEQFVQHISVTVTEMFRDPSFYKELREKTMKRLATYPFLKIWIAGCATGEELYSVAIMLREEGLLDRSVIYATDLNQKSLNVAREGIYPMQYMQKYTSNYLAAGGKKSFSEYYRASHDAVIFDKSLRRNTVLAPHNLATDGSFNEFQLIICRNVLIYFNQQLQNRTLNLFYESLCPFGFLALGNKESLLFTDKKDHFGVLDKREKIYVREK